MKSIALGVRLLSKAGALLVTGREKRVIHHTGRENVMAGLTFKPLHIDNGNFSTCSGILSCTLKNVVHLGKLSQDSVRPPFVNDMIVDVCRPMVPMRWLFARYLNTYIGIMGVGDKFESHRQAKKSETWRHIVQPAELCSTAYFLPSYRVLRVTFPSGRPSPNF